MLTVVGCARLKTCTVFCDGAWHCAVNRPAGKRIWNGPAESSVTWLPALSLMMTFAFAGVTVPWTTSAAAAVCNRRPEPRHAAASRGRRGRWLVRRFIARRASSNVPQSQRSRRRKLSIRRHEGVAGIAVREPIGATLPPTG